MSTVSVSTPEGRYYRKLVREAAAELTEMERQSRNRDWEVRRTAAGLYFGDSVLRCGGWAGAFQSRFRRHIESGADVASIARYDELAASIALEFPEYGNDDGTERLWSFLLSDHDPMPGREHIRNSAAQLVLRRSDGRWAEDPDSALDDDGETGPPDKSPDPTDSLEDAQQAVKLAVCALNTAMKHLKAVKRCSPPAVPF